LEKKEENEKNGKKKKKSHKKNLESRNWGGGRAPGLRDSRNSTNLTDAQIRLQKVTRRGRQDVSKGETPSGKKIGKMRIVLEKGL